jgi:hypothetical protein
MRRNESERSSSTTTPIIALPITRAPPSRSQPSGSRSSSRSPSQPQPSSRSQLPSPTPAPSSDSTSTSDEGPSPAEEYGPGDWRLMHAVALYASSQTAKEFIEIVIATFKCPTCRSHAKEYLKNHPITERTKVYPWTVDFHNSVNARNGKSTVPAEKAKLLYQRREYFPKYNKGMWHAFHSMALYTSDDEHFKQVVESLIRTLKTDWANSLADYISRFPIPSNKHYIFTWSVEYHNYVNRLTGKPQQNAEQSAKEYLISLPCTQCQYSKQ